MHSVLTQINTLFTLVEIAAPIMPQNLPETRQAPTKAAPITGIPGRPVMVTNPTNPQTPQPQPSKDIFKPLDDGEIEIPSDDEGSNARRVIQRPPNYDTYPQELMVTLLKDSWQANNRLNKVLSGEYDFWYSMIVEPIESQQDALLALQAYSPDLFLGLKLTYDQCNNMMAQLCDRMNKYNVPAPDNWQQPLEAYRETEDGDDEN